MGCTVNLATSYTRRNARTSSARSHRASTTSPTARRRHARSTSPYGKSCPVCTAKRSNCCMPERPCCANPQPSCSCVRRSVNSTSSASARSPPPHCCLCPKPPETAVELVVQASLSWRQRLKARLEMLLVQRTLSALILVNAVILGLETSSTVMASWGPWLIAADTAILVAFFVEIALRLIAHRLSFFRDPWSVFDFAVVAVALIPASGPLAVLRALRVLRVLRLITLVPSMKRVVGGLLSALPGLGSVTAIIGIIFYVSAVIATGLFGADFPQWFGTLGESGFTLFQIMTLESWAMGIVRPVMDVFPLAWV